MTREEISQFVNQPTPRKIPRGIFREAAKDFNEGLLRKGKPKILIMSMIILFCCSALPLTIYLKNIGNKSTTQGVIVGWKPVEYTFVKEKTVEYRVQIRFMTPNGEVTTNCYTYDKEKIPGRKMITESQDEQIPGVFIRLQKPFPVTVRYIPWYPSIARVRNASFFSRVWFNRVAAIFVFSCLLWIEGFIKYWYYRWKLRNLLMKGQFTTGQVSEIKIIWRLLRPHDAAVVVSFRDQDGTERTWRGKISKYYHRLECRKWSEGSSVGLLYLPGKKNVIIPDIWQTGSSPPAK